MPEFLVCNPEFFEVSYIINPHMDPKEWASHKIEYHRRACNEWYRYITEIQKIGVDLYYLPPSPGLPDMSFTANGGTILDRKVLLAKFRFPERRGEEPYFLTMFEDLKKKKIIDEIVSFPENIFFEGCGDCLWDPYRKLFWFGYGQRSQLEAADVIRSTFNVEVIPLQLKSKVFYHLDTCFCPMTMGDILIYPNAFTNQSLNKIEEYVNWKEQVIIPHEWFDINKLAMNAICIDKTIIISRCSSSLDFQLYDKGYNVIKTPLDAFLKSGGGPACLRLSLSDTSN